MSLAKTDLVTKLSEQVGLSKKDSTFTVESTLRIIKADLEKGNDVMISGFGKWSVRAKKDGKGRNPQTGESITVTARKVVTFKTSPVLKDG